ncbi:MAG TPA: zinc-dependent metalloprotease [Acidimicrobiia bacterium]
MGDTPQPGGPEDPDDPDDSSPRADSPFPGIPGFPFGGGGLDIADLMRMLQSEGPVNWDIAGQVSSWVALDGGVERPVDPADREQLAELVRAAQTHVVAETGLAASFAVPMQVLTPKAWADLHLDALRVVLEALATTLGDAMRGDEDEPRGDTLQDPTLEAESMEGAAFDMEMFAGMLPMLAPVLLGMQAGSMIGYLAQHALGRYDLPLPTSDAPSLCFVVQNLDAFEEAWSLPRADLRFYCALHEVTHAAQRSVPWVQQRLVELATRYVSSYEIDPSAFEAEFGIIDPTDPSSMSGIAEHPEALLGAMQSPRQQALLEELQLFTSVLEGYTDSVLERIGRKLVPTFNQIHEAMKRHRVERGEAARFIEGLLGLKLDREHYEQGEAFCQGVLERAGPEGLNRLWTRASMLPTRPELEAPGLWLARIDLPEG